MEEGTQQVQRNPIGCTCDVGSEELPRSTLVAGGPVGPSVSSFLAGARILTSSDGDPLRATALRDLPCETASVRLSDGSLEPSAAAWAPAMGTASQAS